MMAALVLAAAHPVSAQQSAKTRKDSAARADSLKHAMGKMPGMAVWRERLFAAMHLNANLPAAYFGVPTGQVVEMGLEVEI